MQGGADTDGYTGSPAPRLGRVQCSTVTAPDPARLGELGATPGLVPGLLAASRARAPTPGEPIGRYVVLDTLGTGGMGAVYAARDTGLDRCVALKVLHASVEQQRLVREAKALARLAHPNVVAVYDVGTYDKRTFVAMELVEGATVRGWMRAAPRGWREIVEVLAGAARGLSAAHEAGLVHRDFKPDNVLVGRDGRARVVDFGLVSEAREAAERAEAPRRTSSLDDLDLTQSGIVMGTPAYMAPEQFRSETADARSDQFAFAVTLWECLFGERPFRGTSFAGLMVTVTRGELVDPPDPSRAPRWLHKVLRRALAVEPMARFPSMDALRAELEAGLASADARVPVGAGRYEPIDAAGDGTQPRRLLDKLTDQVVTLQPLVVDRRGDAAAARLRASRAFMALMTLDHPHLVRVLDFSVDETLRAHVVLDAAGHAEALEDVARRSSPTVRKNLLAQLLGAIGYLHRRERVHGDLSPRHVRVAQGQVKLLVLGDAALPAPRAASASVPPAVGGSDPAFEPLREVGLLAPECRAGAPPSVASDLWTFGVIARRVLGDAGELDPEVDAVLARLTHAAPASRFATAREAAAALGAAIGTPAALDTAETRESFLQPTRLVAREHELGLLSEALQAATRGHGSAWLVGGESGVGKSRLVDELRALAHVEGVLVVRGSVEPASGPYGPWREVLRALVVGSELKELEASVLLPVIPELPRLLGRPVSPAPELDGPSMHARLRQVVLRALQRQSRPMLVLLEDVHWAESASLALLHELEPHIATLPTMLVTTYRPEEGAQVREALGAFRAITLARLGPDSVSELAAAMLGRERVRPELAALLLRESEGNPFFAVEVVRALAEDAGGVDHISERALPERVLAGGMRRVLRRRVERMPTAALEALRLAAALGRRVDPRLLAHALPSLSLEAWLHRGIDAAVLERSGVDVHFAHDKLREEVLRELDADARRALHAHAAATIEAVYGESPRWLAALAYHHREAGNAAREAHCAARAGELALTHGAHREAAERLERALSLGMSTSAAERARLVGGLGAARFFAMDFERAQSALEEMLRVAGVSPPRSRLERGLFLARQLLRQARRRVLGPPPQLVAPEARSLAAEGARVAARLANLALFRTDELGVLAYSLLAVDLAERVGKVDHLSLSFLGFAASAAGLTGVADRAFARVHEAPAQRGELRGLAAGGLAESAAYLGRAELVRAERRANENLEQCAALGDRLLASYAEYMTAVIAYYRGSPEEALHGLAAAQLRLDPADQRHGAVGFAAFEIWVAAQLGQLDRAEARIAATRGAFRAYDRLAAAIWHGAHAFVEARQGRLEPARAAVAEALRHAPNSRSVAPTGGALIAGLVETALLGRATFGVAAEPELSRALAYARAWARIYPIARPSVGVLEARAEQLRGRAARAQALLERSAALSRAQGNGMGSLEAELAGAERPALPPQLSEDVPDAMVATSRDRRERPPG
jgi:serine/threonine protein kinase